MEQFTDYADYTNVADEDVQGDGYRFQQLKNEILSRSRSQVWSEAKKEWYLLTVWRSDAPMTCLCGHTPIIEICVIKNRETGIQTRVGNVCVHNFLNLKSHLVFDCLGRIADDEYAALNEETRELAFSNGWVDEWERRFSESTMRKRKLSGKQLNQRARINTKILKKTGFRGSK